MNKLGLCFCGSKTNFKDCSQKYINGTEKAPTALALMKSRYAAYCAYHADYLMATTHASQRKYYTKEEILNWAKANDWQKLEIISSTESTVEFKAYFLDSNKQNQVHYEFSTFKKENGFWFYVDGKFK